MKKLFALVMFFSLVMVFAPPEKVVNVNISDDICAIDQNQDINITTDCNLIAEFNFELINESEVEISPGLNQEVFITSTEINSRNLQSNKSKIKAKFDNKIKSNYLLNQEILEISPGDNFTQTVLS